MNGKQSTKVVYLWIFEDNGIMDNIVYVTMYIQITFSRDERAMETLLDIESATNQ